MLIWFKCVERERYTCMYISVKQYLSPVKRGKRDIFRIELTFLKTYCVSESFPNIL